MVHVAHAKIQILCEFEPKIYFNFEFDLFEIGVGDDYLAQDAGLDHSDEGLHLFVIGMEGIGDDVVDAIWGLMI